MLYAIYAYEQIYDGLHGMNTTMIVDCDSESEAEEIAIEASYEVMNSYSSITEAFYEEASEKYEKNTSDWYYYVDELMKQNIAYEIYPITDAQGESIWELENELLNDKKGFIETYCQQ